MSDSKNPHKWITHAHSDLLFAQRIPVPGIILEHLCFHSQQVVEKALKAVNIHLTGSLAEFTPFAVVSRYPADLGEISAEEWQHGVCVAQAVVAWAEQVIAGEES